MPGLGTRLSQGPGGVNRPNDPAQPHLGTHPQALPIAPQAMPKLCLCLCLVLPLALSPGWTPWTHAVTLSPALSLDSSAAPDWSPWTWFVPLLCLVLFIDPVTSPGSAPCVQPEGQCLWVQAWPVPGSPLLPACLHLRGSRPSLSPTRWSSW